MTDYLEDCILSLIYKKWKVPASQDVPWKAITPSISTRHFLKGHKKDTNSKSILLDSTHTWQPSWNPPSWIQPYWINELHDSCIDTYKLPNRLHWNSVHKLKLILKWLYSHMANMYNMWHQGHPLVTTKENTCDRRATSVNPLQLQRKTTDICNICLLYHKLRRQICVLTLNI